ncbi:MAG: hypothetical protein AAGG01_22420, partial [Planctomycetota bacterium]
MFPQVALVFLGFSSVLDHSSASPVSEGNDAVRRNLGASFSEDERVGAALASALAAFLEEVEAGEFTGASTVPDDLERYGFFYDGLRGLGSADGESASLLKSYPLGDDGRHHRLTVAFTGLRDGLPYVRKIVELRAEAHREGYRFGCVFPERTSHLASTEIGAVTFRHLGALDLRRAAEFVAFRERIDADLGLKERPLEYFCFETLDDLLKAYGFVFDVHRCNFLRCDLGFSDDAGRRFATGTGDPAYAFEYVGEALAAAAPEPELLYSPFVTGMSAYYGGYSLSGDRMPTLRAQFRERLAGEPEIDFLEEYRKGRGSSVARHFSHFVMCAFLCEAV